MVASSVAGADWARTVDGIAANATKNKHDRSVRIEPRRVQHKWPDACDSKMLVSAARQPAGPSWLKIWRQFASCDIAPPSSPGFDPLARKTFPETVLVSRQRTYLKSGGFWQWRTGE